MADFCLCMKRSEPESEGKKMRKIIECMIHREKIEINKNKYYFVHKHFQN